MKTVEYTGRVLADGHLEVPALARHELKLYPNVEVKVILMRDDEISEESRRDAQRAEVWRQVDALRESLSTKDFSLTDSLLRSR